MALPDLTGQNIENTYQRVLQTDGINFYDGTGSAVSLGGSQNLQQVTDQGASTTIPITASAISSSGTIEGLVLGGTLNTAIQTGITQLGNLTTLTVDQLKLNSNTLSSTSDNDVFLNLGEGGMGFQCADGDNFSFNTNQHNVDLLFAGTSDQSLFYIDSSENKIGIGTITPGEKLEVIGNISASEDIIVTNITTSGDIIPTTHLTSNIGNDDNYFLTASIGRVRTFDTTIEFIDPTTKAIKGTLAITDSGLEVKNASRALTTISASNAKITNKLQTNDISFSGTLIGTITGGTF